VQDSSRSWSSNDAKAQELHRRGDPRLVVRFLEERPLSCDRFLQRDRSSPDKYHAAFQDQHEKEGRLEHQEERLKAWCTSLETKDG